jgi:Rod binding domain-containing protein
MSGSLSIPTLRAPPRQQELRAPRQAEDRAQQTRQPSEAALRRAARDFEAQTLGLLLQPMFATVDNARGTFGGGAGESQWRPMLVDAYAAAAARAGGLGIAEPVYQHLRRQAAGQATPAAPSPTPIAPRSTTP